MKCSECGRFSLDRVCSLCLTRPRLDVARRPSYVTPTVERTGLLCPCGETEPMVAEVGFWLSDGSALIELVRNSDGELLWHRCAACGSITRETLLPAAI